MWRKKKAVDEDYSETLEDSPRDSQKKVRMFNITFVDKEEHPQSSLIPDGFPAIAVNGTVGGRLKLRKGYIYYFNVKPNPIYPDVHFYLTTDPYGGPDNYVDSVGNTIPIASGAFNLDVDRNLPPKFYYQLKEAANAGGNCIVD